MFDSYGLEIDDDVDETAYHPCGYRPHRSSDWVTPTSVVQCGTCHPPALEYPGIVRRGQPGFLELEAAAIARMTARRPRCACQAILHTEQQLRDATCSACSKSDRRRG